MDNYHPPLANTRVIETVEYPQRAGIDCMSPPAWDLLAHGDEPPFWGDLPSPRKFQKKLLHEVRAGGNSAHFAFRRENSSVGLLPGFPPTFFFPPAWPPQTPFFFFFGGRSNPLRGST